MGTTTTRSKPTTAQRLKTYRKFLKEQKQERHTKTGFGPLMDSPHCCGAFTHVDHPYKRRDYADWVDFVEDKLRTYEEKYPSWCNPLLGILEDYDHSQDVKFIADFLYEEYCFKGNPKILIEMHLAPALSRRASVSSSNNSFLQSQDPGHEQVFKENLVASCLFDDAFSDLMKGDGIFHNSSIHHHLKHRFQASLPPKLVPPAKETQKKESYEELSVVWEDQPAAVNRSPVQYKNNTILATNFYVQPVEQGPDRSSIIVREQIAQQEVIMNYINKMYKNLTTAMQRHFKHPHSIFNLMMRTFCLTFQQNYQWKVTQYAKEPGTTKEDVKKLTDRACDDIKTFVSLIYETIVKYYCLQEILVGHPEEMAFIFSEDNLINFILSLVFECGDIYGIVFSLFELFAHEEIQRTRTGLARVGKENLEYFGVNAMYRLDQSTIQVIDEKLKAQAASESAEKQAEMKKNARKVNEQRTSGPYATSIDMLTKIVSQKNPLHKMKHVLKVAQSINTEIKSFHSKHGYHENVVIDGDQIFSILLYITVKANLPTLAAHLHFINYFATQNLQNSISGYYCVTLQAAIEHVVEQGEEDI